MQVNKIGNGKKSVGILGAIHGDEPGTAVTVKILENILESESDLCGTVKLIICNEKALKQNTRYVDSDLNRLFNSVESKSNYENKLSEKILSICSDLDIVLSLHSSKSAPPSFAITNTIDKFKNDICSLPVEYVVEQQAGNGSLETEMNQVINIELGRQFSNQVIYNGIKSVKNLLSHRGIIDNNFEYTKTNVIKSSKTLKKKGSSPKVYYKNFEKISKGDTIAEDSKIKHIADQSNLRPYLLSKYGYDDIFGHIGVYKGYIKNN